MSFATIVGRTTTLVVFALAALLIVSLGLGLVGTGPSFNPADRQILLERYPGGSFTSDRVYERCENQRFVYYYPDGTRATHEKWCWR